MSLKSTIVFLEDETHIAYNHIDGTNDANGKHYPMIEIEIPLSSISRVEMDSETLTIEVRQNKGTALYHFLEELEIKGIEEPIPGERPKIAVRYKPRIAPNQNED